MLGADAPVAAPAAARIFHWRPFLAPFHAVVLHFPIGFVTVAFLLEAYRTFRPSDEIRRVTVMVLWLGLITGVISASFGLMRAGSGEYEARLLELKQKMGVLPASTSPAAKQLPKGASGGSDITEADFEHLDDAPQAS